MSAVPLGLVAAIARNGVIGTDGALPWRLRSDLQHFRALTLGKPVVMGRKTFESIGRVLPGRRVIVVTRNLRLRINAVDVTGSVDEALALAKRICSDSGVGEIAVAGGGEIFRATIDLATALHLTEVDAFPSGDVRFPEVDRARWREVSREVHGASEWDEVGFAFVEYVRS